MSTESSTRRALIVDTDVAFDDIVAIKSLLVHKQVDLITTTCGASTSSRGASVIRSLFPEIGKVVASPDVPRDEPQWVHAFRETLDKFMEENVGVTQECREQSKITSKQAVQDLLLEQDVDILCLGPLSNIAHWFENNDNQLLYSSRVKSIWILGGNLPEMQRESFNFAQDPEAVAKVLQNPHLMDKIVIVPSDASSSQVSSEYLDSIVAQCQKNPDSILAKAIQTVPPYAIFSDPICTFLYLYPQAASYDSIHITNIDPYTGIITDLPVSNQNNNHPLVHKMVRNVQLEGKSGFKEWITSIIQSYANQE